MKALAWIAVALAGCATVRCGEEGACRLHPRECRVELGAACRDCAGMILVCVPRPRREQAALDEERRRCPAAPFSYTQGCLCGAKPCRSDKQRCQDRGGTWFTGDGTLAPDCLLEGDLSR